MKRFIWNTYLFYEDWIHYTLMESLKDFETNDFKTSTILKNGFILFYYHFMYSIFDYLQSKIPNYEKFN